MECYFQFQLARSCLVSALEAIILLSSFNLRHYILYCVCVADKRGVHLIALDAIALAAPEVAAAAAAVAASHGIK